MADGTKGDGLLAPGGALEGSAELDPTEERVARCAAALFEERGIAQVKMTDIAEAAGVGVATLYRRFQTKASVATAAATLLWERFNRQIMDLVESDGFLAMDGAERLQAMLQAYADALVAHPSFVSLVDEFDHLALEGGVGDEELAAYGRVVGSFYLVFQDAYELGVADGSVRRVDRFDAFYRAVAHALLGVAEKLSRGEVLPTDDFSDGAVELSWIVQMAVRCLATRPDGP